MLFIENIFSVPIYVASISDTAILKVQAELGHVYNDLCDKGKFNYNPKLKTHMLSDVTFKSNLLTEYDTTVFQNELDFHLLNYMTMIQSGIGVDRPYQYKIENSWMTLNPKDSYANIHTHGDSDIAGVYYYKTNGNDGDLMFDTPIKLMKHSYCFNHYQHTLTHNPQVGQIVLFPGWLEHGTTTNTTNNDRVSLSFNINFIRG